MLKRGLLLLFLLILSSSLVLGLTSLKLDKTNLKPGDILKISITNGENGYLNKLYFYSDSLVDIVELDCGKEICYGTKTLDFEIPLDWDGKYSVVVYDYGLHDYSKKEFSVVGVIKLKTFSADLVDKNLMYIKNNFSNNTSINENLPKTITSILATGYVELNTELAFARIIVEDNNGKEYLIFASDSLAMGRGIHNFTSICEETCDILPLKPKIIKVDLYNANIFIDNFEYREKMEGGVSIQALEERISNKKKTQSSEKVKLINKRIQNKGYKWTAGETPILSMSYEEKKKLFRGKLPNLYGFDAYKSGIFDLPTETFELNNEAVRSLEYAGVTSLETGSAPISFDWRNKHGENWLSPVRNQGNCGSCWAYAAVGAMEGVINMYYNQHLDMNFSEQYLLSCCATLCNSRGHWGCVAGGYGHLALDYINMTGIVDENCFPYTATDNSCSNKCVDWESRVWKVDGRTKVPGNIYSLKRALYQNGSLIMEDNKWNHEITAVGYGEDESTNSFYVIFKNSWGGDWGMDGYGLMMVDESDLAFFVARFVFYIVEPPFTFPLGINFDVLCVDNDNDNFCNWGIGPKPGSCPLNCGEFPDFDDSNSAVTGYEDCEIIGDEDGDGLADCADTDCIGSFVFCNQEHTRICNSRNMCEVPENCEISGDEDGDGLADCADVDSCPERTFCNAEEHTMKCYYPNTCSNSLRMLFNRSFYNIYNPNRDSIGKSVSVDNNGNIYVVGDTSITSPTTTYRTLWLLKFDSDGNKIWDWFTNYTRPGNDLSIAPDGSIYALGDSSEFDINGLWLLKFDPDGNVLWNITLRNYYGFGISAAPDGSVYVSSTKLLKFDSDGNKIWEAGLYSIGVSVAPDGNIYVLNPIGRDRDLYLSKFDPDGNKIWESIVMDDEFSFLHVYSGDYDISVAHDGSIYVTGGKIPSGFSDFDLFLSKFNSSGNKIWERTVRDRYDEMGSDIAFSTNNDVYVVGYSYIVGTLYDNMWLLKFDSDGNVLSDYFLLDYLPGYMPNTRTNVGLGISSDRNNNIYVTGETYAYSHNISATSRSDLWLLKFADVYDVPSLATHTFPRGWNLISLPLQPDNPNPSSVFDVNVINFNLHRYDIDAMGYISYSIIAPSRFGNISVEQGYWLYCWDSAGCTASYSGSDAINLIPLDLAGWHLIGVPSVDDVYVNDIQVEHNGQIRSIAEAATGADKWIELPFKLYVQETNGYLNIGPAGMGTIWDDNYLYPWYGYWIKTLVNDVKLKF